MKNQTNKNQPISQPKKTFKEKLFKPMDRKTKDIFMRVCVLAFIFSSVVVSYFFHWGIGLYTTISLLVTLYFIFVPYKQEEKKGVVKIEKKSNFKKKRK